MRLPMVHLGRPIGLLTVSLAACVWLVAATPSAAQRTHTAGRGGGPSISRGAPPPRPGPVRGGAPPPRGSGGRPPGGVHGGGGKPHGSSYHGGHHHGGSYWKGGWSGSVIIGGPWWWDPWWGPWWGPRYAYPYVYYPPPYGYYPPVDPPLDVPSEYIQRRTEPGDRPSGYWYYCPSARAYYPDVERCPEEWIKVLPSPE